MLNIKPFNPPRTIAGINQMLRYGTLIERLQLLRWWKHNPLQPYVARDYKEADELHSIADIKTALDTTFKGETIDLHYKGHVYTIRVVDVDHQGPKIHVTMAEPEARIARVPRGTGDRRAGFLDVDVPILVHSTIGYDVTDDADKWLDENTTLSEN